MRPISVPPLIRIGALFGATLLIVAACTSSTGGASTAPSVAPSAAATAAASAAAGGETYTVAVVTDAKLGSYITGEDGKTLYTFAADSANTTACKDACAAMWPPFTVASDDTLTPGAGVTGALTTFARPDGKMQVAINGRPLYYFAADSKAGDTTGQGFAGKWFVATPTGVTAPPAASPAASPAATAKGAY
jgi:predicted lipoprotein with Yx(FWY)xxD motif